MTGAVASAVIVGGGIGGLTAAIALRHAGIDAMVYERAREPRPLGAGIMLTINGMLVLDGLGLTAGVCARGNRLTTLALVDEQGRSLTEIDLVRIGSDRSGVGHDGHRDSSRGSPRYSRGRGFDLPIVGERIG